MYNCKQDKILLLMQKYNKSKAKTYQNVEDGIFRKKNGGTEAW